MKRFRFGDQIKSMESINMARVLMHLAAGDRSSGDTQPSRVFECKTCSRQFSSFQALGGHRASHKKPRQPEEAGELATAKPKVHECSICGLEFAIGQALGGHMRRHRGSQEGIGGHDVVEKKAAGGKRVLWLDLNLPPVEEGEDRLKMGLGLGCWGFRGLLYGAAAEAKSVASQETLKV